MTSKAKIIGLVLSVSLIAASAYMLMDGQTTTSADAAQGAGAAPQYDGRPESRQPAVDAYNPLATYRPAAGTAGAIALDEISARGVPKTVQSVKAARELLSGTQLSIDERASMIRILASLHDPENSTGLNNEIASDLKAMTRDADDKIASRAAMFYARLGYEPGVESVLRDAYNRGALSETDYGREIGHLVASAPPEKRRELIKAAQALSDPLAAQILTTALLSGEEFNAADYLKSSPEMAALLQSKEPNFGMPVGLYGGVTGINYDEWLRASALIESQKSGVNMDQFIIDKLSEPSTDPRKILAVLSSPAAEPMLANAPPDSPLHALIAKARLHAAQNGHTNQYMTALMQQIDMRTKTPPPRTNVEPVFTPPTGPLSAPLPVPNAPHSIPRQ